MDKIDEAFEVALGMVETRLFKEFRKDESLASIELTNLDIEKLRNGIEVFDGSVYRTLPLVITCMVEQLLKNNALSAYLDSKSTMKALGKLLHCIRIM